MFGIGQPELLVILFIVLLVFGPSKLPKLSKTLGESAAALKDGFTDGKNDKSLKEITKEMTSSAREIKQGINEVAHLNPLASRPAPQPPEATVMSQSQERPVEVEGA